jgi:hypothetical protein
MTKLDNEVCELTMNDLGEISGGAALSIETGWAHIDMGWSSNPNGCKIIIITSGTRTTSAQSGAC